MKKLIDLAPGELKPYVNNPRKNDEAVFDVIKSIKKFGFRNPILVDENYEVLAGHTRLKAAIKMQLEKVPVIVFSDLSEDKKKAYRIADNKTGEKAEWDNELLGIELHDLDEGLNSATGFSDKEIDKLLRELERNAAAEYEGITDDDEVPEAKESICKHGDLWRLGRHRLLCGDATNVDDVDRLMDCKKADMIFTDQPYNLNYDFSNNGMVQSGQRKARFGKIKNDCMGEDEFKNFISGAFSNIFMIMKEGSSFYISGGRESTQLFNNILSEYKFHIAQWLIWIKENFNISRLSYHPKHEIITYGWKKGASHQWYNNRSQVDVVQFKRNIGKSVHPTEKPVSLIQYFISNSSMRNQIIIDLFMGSGSTLIACEKSNRICYGMEIDPHYCDVIIERWQNFTGQKAELINQYEGVERECA